MNYKKYASIFLKMQGEPCLLKALIGLKVDFRPSLPTGGKEAPTQSGSCRSSSQGIKETGSHQGQKQLLFTLQGKGQS